MDIKVTTGNGKTTLAGPYHADLPPLARGIGGKFASGVWTFDSRDEQRVRDLARKVYGTDGTPGPVVTVRIRMDDFAPELGAQRGPQSLWLLGREVVTRRARDYDVRLGDGVVVIEGGFPGSGGSVQNPRVHAHDGTILEIRDVPAGHPHLSEYAGRVQVVEDEQPAADVDALLAERDRLLARLAEIDALLPEPEGTEVSTRQAAAALGVSVRTVQRWACTGKVAAAKDGRGRWVITITVGS